MDELIRNSVLEELFNKRSEEISHYCILNSKEYKELENAMENKLKELLRYVSSEYRELLEEEIEDFLFDHILGLSEYWCSRYYKIGFADGLNVKKEIEEELEELTKWKKC